MVAGEPPEGESLPGEETPTRPPLAGEPELPLALGQWATGREARAGGELQSVARAVPDPASEAPSPCFCRRLECLQRIVTKLQMEAGLCEEQLNQADTLLQSVRGVGQAAREGGQRSLPRPAAGKPEGGCLPGLLGRGRGGACGGESSPELLPLQPTLTVLPTLTANSHSLLWAELVSGHPAEPRVAALPPSGPLLYSGLLLGEG